MTQVPKTALSGPKECKFVFGPDASFDMLSIEKLEFKIRHDDGAVSRLGLRIWVEKIRGNVNAQHIIDIVKPKVQTTESTDVLEIARWIMRELTANAADKLDAMQHLAYAKLGDILALLEQIEIGAGRSANNDDWILVTKALTRLSFIRNGLKGLNEFSRKNPGKLRIRPHPEHRRRRQAYAPDVLRLEMEHDHRDFEKLDTPAADNLPPISEINLQRLTERADRIRARKAK